MKQQPTVEELRETFLYEPSTGRLLWARSRNLGRGKAKAGASVGSLNGCGYMETSINGYRTYVHRIAWAIHHGAWPEKNIDHIDGNKLNNSITNLRDCDQRVNVENRRTLRTDNTSGFTGVMWRSDRKRWCAIIQANGRRKRLGSFDTPEQANAAYLSAKKMMHEGNTL